MTEVQTTRADASAAQRQHVYLGAIRYAAGGLQPVETEIADSSVCAALRAIKHGADTFAKHEGDLMELSEAAIGACLASCAGGAGEIDAVLFVSCILDATDNLHPTWLAQLAGRHGLDQVPHYHLGITGCAGFHWAARMANALVASGSARSVLIVTFDKVGPPLQRLYGAGSDFMYVTGDAAAACVVSGSPAGMDYRVVGDVENVFDSRQYLVPSMDGEINKIADLFALTYKGAKKTCRDVDHLVTNNYSLEISRLFAQLAGVSFSTVFTSSIGKYAHCFSSDNLINLSELGEQALAGQTVLCFSAGPSQWGACLLERMEASGAIQ
ncbi:3-oxoacyl-[acyl-carrier-protein] synthase III C-terminal domain-containing protein [Methylibium sp.]|uniref:3-oxoacyl-[acyl-carrier-protein] synthase III C-terminal domain-containing protein n=1 Tax=Methylibium sp. TaxID=2067992 RepID=UPI003D0C1693